MEKTYLFAILSSLPLVAGAFLGLKWKPGKQITGVLLAFASGALISAAANELFKEAYELGGAFVSGLALLIGAITFVSVNTLIDRRIDSRKGEDMGEREKLKKGSSAIGWALIAAVTLDGVPENIALGLSIESTGGLALLVAVFVSNFPESLVGSIAMHRAGNNPRFILSVWTATAVALALSVVGGSVLANILSPTYLSMMLAFAGGAVIASLADTLMPEAFEHGKPFNAFATAFGFFTSFYIAHV